MRRELIACHVDVLLDLVGIPVRHVSPFNRVAVLGNYPRAATRRHTAVVHRPTEGTSHMPPTPRLAVGDKAPAFSLPDADGNTVKLGDFKGRKVIVYFYPAASTPGCTKQACDFRDSLAELNEAGLDVVGISPDKPEKLAKFRDAEGLTFPLLSDPDRKVLDRVGRLRREVHVRQDRSGRHPVDVRRRREGQDRGRPVQRQGHRPRREAAPRPSRSSGLATPSASSSSASDVAARSSTPRSRLSLMLCACVAGSSTPVTRILASGKAAANSAMNGIDPPTPMSTASVPQACRNAARAAS